jgi:hypothetical protein
MQGWGSVPEMGRTRVQSQQTVRLRRIQVRRNPLVILSAPAALYVYLLIRGLGRWLAATATGLPAYHTMVYKVLPTFGVLSNTGDIAPVRSAILILAGPALVLLAGYLLLVLVSLWGERLPSWLRLFLCLTCYLGLILDPIYYAVIPLLRLGGEPGMLMRITGAPSVALILPAMVLLGLNVMLTRNRMVPLIRRKDGS